jgi:starvation-inducible outer membrane lipoprotein
MKAITLSATLIISFGVLLSGCWPCPKPIIKEKYVYKPKKVLVPVKCIVPDSNCSINKDMTRVDVVDEMYRCIKQQEENAKVCQDQK